jgi:AhpC/TSA family
MSSSATTEPSARAGAQRRVPVVLMVAAILAVLLVIGGVLALLGLTTPSSAPPTSSMVGVQLTPKSFPRLQMVNEKGRMKIPWGHHHGAVLLFFANWCTVCHGEIHRLAKVLGPSIGTVHVIGFDGDISSGVATSFVANNHIRFPVVHDANLLIADTFVPGGLPGTAFVSANGTVKAVDYGAITNMELSAGLSMIGHATHG